ncbi:MAG: hypothetical protein RJB66_285 [Pseudomonadota bacterium]|jgi:hypothetical protein
MIQKKTSILKILASLKLAVFVILALAVVAAVGTIYEARYDAEAAAVLVYRSVWMYVVMGILVVNLVAVMVDRWPWKIRHTGFVLAHIGIIFLLLGGLITQQYGIDGTMYFEIGTSSRTVTITDRVLTLYSTFDGTQFVELFNKDVNFLKTPAKDQKIKMTVEDGEIEIIDSLNYAQTSERVAPSTGALDGSAIRFQLANEVVNELQWLVQSRTGKVAMNQFGPLTLVLGSTDLPTKGVNTLALQALDRDHVSYALYKKENDKPIQSGKLAEGEDFQLPWMNFKFKILRYYPKAHREWEVKPVSRPNPTTTSAVLVKYNNHNQWAQLNDIVRFFSPTGAYILKYGQKQVDLGEKLTLKKFTIGHYQGTKRAMAYESVVEVPGLGEHTISMNNPLQYNGFTFYQASFQQDPRTGEPTASILSVNRDPGRFLKYLGSLLMVLGIIHLFWFKQRQKKKTV